MGRTVDLGKTCALGKRPVPAAARTRVRSLGMPAVHKTEPGPSGASIPEAPEPCNAACCPIQGAFCGWARVPVPWRGSGRVRVESW